MKIAIKSRFQVSAELAKLLRITKIKTSTLTYFTKTIIKIQCVLLSASICRVWMNELTALTISNVVIWFKLSSCLFFAVSIFGPGWIWLPLHKSIKLTATITKTILYALNSNIDWQFKATYLSHSRSEFLFFVVLKMTTVQSKHPHIHFEDIRVPHMYKLQIAHFEHLFWQLTCWKWYIHSVRQFEFIYFAWNIYPCQRRTVSTRLAKASFETQMAREHGSAQLFCMRSFWSIEKTCLLWSRMTPKKYHYYGDYNPHLKKIFEIFCVFYCRR